MLGLCFYQVIETQFLTNQRMYFLWDIFKFKMKNDFVKLEVVRGRVDLVSEETKT